MTNPVFRITNRSSLLFVLAILNVLVILVMQSFGPSLKPFSIIGFEFAGTPEQARLMVNTWKENGVLHSVYFLIGFDYLFMITYSVFLWLACRTVADRLSGGWQMVINIVAWLQPMAALLDAVENLSLYQMVAGSAKKIWPTLSVMCAAPKFIIALTGVTVFVIGGILQIVNKKKTT
jgi:hypothetical protein